LDCGAVKETRLYIGDDVLVATFNSCYFIYYDVVSPYGVVCYIEIRLWTMGYVEIRGKTSLVW